MLKILTFFGADVEGERLSLLQEMFECGYTLLALDTSAIRAAASANIPFTLIDDWLYSEKILQAKEIAAQCERKWFEVARDEFTLEDICWPEFDRHAMHWFWTDVLLAQEFADAFRTQGVRELKFFQNKILQPAIYYLPSDIVSTFWEVELSGTAKALKMPQLTTSGLLVRYASAVINRFGSLSHRCFSIKKESSQNTDKGSYSQTCITAVADKIVLACNPDEFHRFKPITQQLSEHHVGIIVGIVLSSKPETANELAVKSGIPVITEPSPNQIVRDLHEKFLRGYTKAQKIVKEHPWQKALAHLKFHFEYYSKKRWPKLVNTFRAWTELWDQARPRAVIVSSLQDSESQIPAETAKRAGIPTFSIPHGACMTRTWDIISSESILYSLMTQKLVYERSGIAAERLTACRGLVAENEYPTNLNNVSSGSRPWRVLALSDPIGAPGCLAPFTSPSAQLKALRSLDSPPFDVAQKLFLKIKVHPKWTDLEIFATVSRRLEKAVLPPDSELKQALQNIDLVVAVNYCGGALVHVLRYGKPLIFFWTDQLIGRCEPSIHAEIFLPAGILVRSAEGFWGKVRDFFTNPEVAKEMQSKTETFCRKNLVDSNYPTINEVLEGTL